MTAIVVLPTPPLGEKTVTTTPLRSPCDAVGPTIVSQECLARLTAAPSACWSSAGTTAPMPAAIELAKISGASSCRISTTVVAGWVVRIRSASDVAVARSSVGPTTTA